MTDDVLAFAASRVDERAEDLARIFQLSGGSVTIDHLPFLAQVDVRTTPQEAVERGIVSEVGLDERQPDADPRGVRLDRSEGPLHLPTTPNSVWFGDPNSAMWLGPDEWLVIGASGTNEVLASRLRNSLEGVHHSVVDVSANRIVFTMSGPGRNELLAAGCSIDLDPKVWRPRTCAQTLLAGVPVILGQGGAWTAVWVRPSFADYLIDWFLEHAAP